MEELSWETLADLETESTATFSGTISITFSECGSLWSENDSATSDIDDDLEWHSSEYKGN